MELILTILAVVLMGIGVLGTFLPVLPGLGLMWCVAALYGWFEGFQRITPGYLAVMGVLVAIAMVGEHYARAWGARKFGGSRSGAWGAVIGSILGLFFLPIGLFLGPFLGAVLGELITGRQGKEAMRAGLGSMIGVLAGTLGNFTVGLIMFLTFLFRMFWGGA